MPYMIAMLLLVILAVYFAVRFFLSKQMLKKLRLELLDIRCCPEENRILKLTVPDAEMERLLKEMNVFLKERQEERIAAQNKEKLLRRQIENISHDLRTPLTSISGYLALINQENLSKEDQEAVHVIRRKAASLQHLIGAFYDLSRLEAGDYQLQSGKTDICRVLRETMIGFYQVLEERPLRIEADIPEYSVYTFLDENALERIIGNLFQNAARYAGSFLKVSLKVDAKTVLIIFENDVKEDAVPDLSMEDAARLFERFYTQSDARTQNASGLGLTIAKYLTESMSGTISASLKDCCLSFLICFPVLNPALTELPRHITIKKK